MEIKAIFPPLITFKPLPSSKTTFKKLSIAIIFPSSSSQFFKPIRTFLPLKLANCLFTSSIKIIKKICNQLDKSNLITTKCYTNYYSFNL